jgi:hypothetical protein
LSLTSLSLSLRLSLVCAGATAFPRYEASDVGLYDDEFDDLNEEGTFVPVCDMPSHAKHQLFRDSLVAMLKLTKEQENDILNKFFMMADKTDLAVLLEGRVETIKSHLTAAIVAPESPSAAESAIAESASTSAAESVAQSEEPAGDECPICKELMEAGQKVSPSCDPRHVFHEKCLRGWVNRGHSVCPLCREDFQEIVFADGRKERILRRRTRRRQDDSNAYYERELDTLRREQGSRVVNGEGGIRPDPAAPSRAQRAENRSRLGEGVQLSQQASSSNTAVAAPASEPASASTPASDNAAASASPAASEHDRPQTNPDLAEAMSRGAKRMRDGWVPEMLESIASDGLPPTAPELAPKSVRKAAKEMGSGCIIFGGTPTAWEDLGVYDFASDLSTAGMLIGELLQGIDGVINKGRFNIPRHTPRATAVYHVLSREAQEQIMAKAKSTTADELNSRIRKRSEGTRIKRGMQQTLAEGGHLQCPTCSMPTLDPNDPDFDERARRIEQLAQRDKPLPRCSCGNVHPEE